MPGPLMKLIAIRGDKRGETAAPHHDESGEGLNKKCVLLAVFIVLYIAVSAILAIAVDALFVIMLLGGLGLLLLFLCCYLKKCQPDSGEGSE